MCTKSKSYVIYSTALLLILLSGRSFAQTESWLWARSVTAAPVALPFSVSNAAYTTSVAPDGNVYVAGAFYSPTLDFGTTTLTNSDPTTTSSDLYLAKYDPLGNVLWARGATGVGNEKIVSIAADASGGVIVTGTFSGTTLVFGTDTLVNHGLSNMFVTKYDRDGNVVWTRCADGTINQVTPACLAISRSGEVVVTGTFNGSNATIFGTDTLGTASNTELFVVKYDASGNELWAKRTHSTGVSTGNSVATDALGNVFVAGFTDAPALTFGLDTLRAITLDPYQIVLAKFDSAGNLQWDRLYADMNNEFSMFVNVDNIGNIFLGGTFTVGPRAYMVFGTDSIQATAQNVFLVKIDGSGNTIWAKKAGGNTFVQASGMTISATGAPYIIGTYSGSPLIFASDTLATLGSIMSDGFIFQFSTGGNEVWAANFGGNRDDVPCGIATNTSGEFYVAGYFNSDTICFGTDILSNQGLVVPGSSTGPYYPFLAKYGHTGSLHTADLLQRTDLSVYPNPLISSSLTAKFTAGNYNNISIFNAMGATVYSCNLNPSEKSKLIDLPALPDGFYYLKAGGNGDGAVVKLVVGR